MIVKQIGSERLAYWYLRLNGFLTIPSFIVHPDTGRDPNTDVDVVGVRLPHRAENLVRPMTDAPIAHRAAGKTFVAFVEVKRGRMGLNGPWTDRSRDNMFRLLMAIGPYPPDEARRGADALYDRGVYDGELFHTELVCIGARENPHLVHSHPGSAQITFPVALVFIYERMRGYRGQKRSNGQWDTEGVNLFDAADQSESLDEFIQRIEIDPAVAR